MHRELIVVKETGKGTLNRVNELQLHLDPGLALDVDTNDPIKSLVHSVKEVKEKENGSQL